MALLIFYGDESGTADKSNVAVAGYVARVDQWNNLAFDWQLILDEEGISCLHRADMESFYGEFREWDLARQHKVIRRANDIIKKRTLRGIGFSVKMKAYHRLVPPQMKRFLGGAYGLCVYCCVVSLSRWAKAQDHWITYIFESGAPSSGQVGQVLNAFSAIQDYRMVSHTFAPKKADAKGAPAVVQLQAADFIAYEAHKHIDNRVVEGIKRGDRKSKDLLIRLVDDLYFLDDQLLAQFLIGARTK